ncbi:MAG: SGNH/GDSL hydrolase family protein [Treponema sp.]|nr:SGNH/GDSL hydrolase family protein [Treponema sp.]
MLIELIGDSITCGYGVEGKSAEEPFTTQTENALKAYAWLTAQNLDADCTLTSFSGFGIVSGWTDSGDLNSIQLVPKHYGKFAFSWNSKRFQNVERDFSGRKAQIVVINLGTNDDSYTRDIEERQAQYASEYVKFIKEVRAKNPDAHLILCLGIMLGGIRLLPWMDKAAADYRAETGDERISTLHFTPQTPEEGFGSDYHPSQATQIRSARELSDFIKMLN